MAKLLTFSETLRHLRSRQIYHQLKKRILPVRSVAALPMRWRTGPSASARGAAPKNTDRVFFDGASAFTFNNEMRTFAGNWDEADARKLWRYNLHYMGWIFDLPPAGRDAWIRRWREGNPAGKGTGWEPYPVSLRIFNWCKHHALEGRAPDAETLASLGMQVSWLLAHLEFHLGANHLLENLLALALAGFHLAAADPRAAKALVRIRRFLEAELAEQFLPDGGHCELSPMYHAIVLERMLDLLACWPEDAGDPFPGLKPKVEAVARAGLDWLETMTVGGRFALFNDACYDAAPDADRVLAYGTRLLGYRPRPKAPLKSLPASGYHRAEAGPLTVIFDGGELGPDWQMGHAQGDMLSFCLWVQGEPPLVHPGNYEYVSGAMRDYCRSTAAHNTLVVDGQEQADWWAAHRVGWRGHPRDVSAAATGSGAVRLEGAHDGYSRLPGRPLHRRTLDLTADALRVTDVLTADPGRPSRIHFHFHPEATVRLEGDKVRAAFAGGVLTLESDHPVKLEETWHCPEFGLRLRNVAAVVECKGMEARTLLSLVKA